MFNPLTITGRVANDDVGDPLRLEPTAYLSAIETALKAKSAKIIVADGQTIRFKPIPQMHVGFLLAGVSQGVIETSKVRDRPAISYRLEVPFFLVASLIAVVLLYFLIRHNVSATPWKNEQYWAPFVGFLWLYGGNYIILMVRFRVFIGRAISSAAASIGA